MKVHEPFVYEQLDGGAAVLRLVGWESRFPKLTAGFTTRQGGNSKPPIAGLNCALHVEDESEAVAANRALLAAGLGWDVEAWTCAEQTHGDNVRQVKAEDRGKGLHDRHSALQDTDALITDVPGILLASFYADCVPLFIYDPESNAVGLAHAGWKGTVKEIGAKTVEAMQQAFGSRPEQLLAAIGPAIGSCCYEVDEPVIRLVLPLAEQLSAEGGVSVEKAIMASGDGKARLNLKELNRQIMIKAGILPTNIELTTYCTGCRTDLFFSHRKEAGVTGRMSSYIGIMMR